MQRRPACQRPVECNVATIVNIVIVIVNRRQRRQGAG